VAITAAAREQLAMGSIIVNWKAARREVVRGSTRLPEIRLAKHYVAIAIESLDEFVLVVPTIAKTQLHSRRGVGRSD
jgi:hypothetical protein